MSDPLLSESPVDILSPAAVKDRLGTRSMGCEVHCFDSVGSTMDEAFRLAAEGSAEGAVVTAEEQTNGRGRQGRAWVSPKGDGLYFSLILRPDLPSGEIALLTLLSAVALVEAIEAVAGVQVFIKWPNDLLVDERKLAGILTELRTDGNKRAVVVVGVGVNVRASGRGLPQTAVAIEGLTDIICTRVGLLQAFLRCFERHYFSLEKSGWPPILRVWRERSAVTGRRIRFEEHGKVYQGKALGLADDGGLVIELENGQTVKRMAGDISL